MQYILIAVLSIASTTSAPTIAMIEFNDREACANAAAAVKDFGSAAAIGVKTDVGCVPKGTVAAAK